MKKRGLKMTVGIIGAMEEEVAVLKKEMELEEIITVASMEFCKGLLCGKDVVVVRSGIGKVNAAVCTQILIDRFGADVIINTGVAGSLDAKIDIGDMVVSTDLVEHDMDTTAFGDPLGQVPRMDTFSFPADVELVKKAVLANEEANPDIKTFTGRIVSGDQFVSSPDVKDKLVENFGAKCTEMEGAAIAHVAYLNKVSCVIIRAISDKADNSASMDYPSFEKKAIEHSLRLVRNLLPRI
jgi:adenosylhomocysteine nucleosidase